MKIFSFIGNIFHSNNPQKTVQKENQNYNSESYPNLAPLPNDVLTISTPVEETKNEKDELIEATSIINENCRKYAKSYFKNVELFKNFDETNLPQINDFLKNLGIPAIMLFATGNKPMVWSTSAKACIFDKFKSDKVDVITFANENDEDNDVYLLNKNTAKNIIKENKELFIKRMNLPENTGVEEIYDKLWDEDSPLAKHDSDLIGLLLGYPKMNTLIYNLEKSFDKTNNFRHYAPIEMYKERLSQFVYSDESPYKDMSEDFKKELYNAINNIEKIQHSREFIFGEAKKEYNMGIDFICFTNEPQAMKELKAKILDFAKTLSSDEYIKIK